MCARTERALLDTLLQSLGDLGSVARPALPALKKAANDEKRGVRLAVQRALQAIEKSPPVVSASAP